MTVFTERISLLRILLKKSENKNEETLSSISRSFSQQKKALIFAIFSLKIWLITTLKLLPQQQQTRSTSLCYVCGLVIYCFSVIPFLPLRSKFLYCPLRSKCINKRCNIFIFIIKLNYDFTWLFI